MVFSAKGAGGGQPRRRRLLAVARSLPPVRPSRTRPSLTKPDLAGRWQQTARRKLLTDCRSHPTPDLRLIDTGRGSGPERDEPRPTSRRKWRRGLRDENAVSPRRHLLSRTRKRSARLRRKEGGDVAAVLQHKQPGHAPFGPKGRFAARRGALPGTKILRTPTERMGGGAG